MVGEPRREPQSRSDGRLLCVRSGLPRGDHRHLLPNRYAVDNAIVFSFSFEGQARPLSGGSGSGCEKARTGGARKTNGAKDVSLEDVLIDPNCARMNRGAGSPCRNFAQLLRRFCGHWMATKTVLEAEPPIDKTRGMASPAGASPGTWTFTW